MPTPSTAPAVLLSALCPDELDLALPALPALAGAAPMPLPVEPKAAMMEEEEEGEGEEAAVAMDEEKDVPCAREIVVSRLVDRAIESVLRGVAGGVPAGVGYPWA